MTDLYAGPGLKVLSRMNRWQRLVAERLTPAIGKSLPLNITNMKSIISLRISQCPKAMLWTSLTRVLDRAEGAEGHDAGAERSTEHTKEADGPSGRHRTWMKMGL